MSVAFGPIIKYTGRLPVFLLGTMLHGSLVVALLFWKPDPSTPYAYFIIAGLWGTADAIWQSEQKFSQIIISCSLNETIMIPLIFHFFRFFYTAQINGNNFYLYGSLYLNFQKERNKMVFFCFF